jgi:hypothetical protein
MKKIYIDNKTHTFYSKAPVLKRFSLVKLKAGENFNRRNTWRILRIKI